MAQHDLKGRTTRAELRIRRKPRNETILTFMAPASAQMFFVRHDPFSQTLLTVRGSRWSQVERRLRLGWGGRGAYTETTVTTPVDSRSIEIRTSLSKGSDAVRTTVTRIGPRGEMGWEARDGAGALLGSGKGIDGEGRASMPGRGEIGFKSEHGKTTHWHQRLDGGGGVDIVETQTDAIWGSRTEQRWEGHDESGASTGTGRLTTYDGPSGGWNLKTETPTPDGGKVVVTASGDKHGGAAHTTVHDASGNIVEEGESVEVINPDGSSSLTTQSMDAAGNSTLTSVVRDADGTVHTHTTVWDRNGELVRDESSDAPGPAEDAPPPSDGDDDGNGDGDGEPDDGGDDTGGEDSGGGDGNGGESGEDGDDTTAPGDDEGDGMGGGRGPVMGNPGGPQYPGDILGRILFGLGVVRGGGGTDEWNEGRGPEVTAEQAARIIAAAHRAPPPGGGEERGDGAGTGRPDIVIAVPVGEFEDWNDHPRPETIQEIMRWIEANVAAMDASRDALRALNGALAADRGPG